MSILYNYCTKYNKLPECELGGCNDSELSDMFTAMYKGLKTR